MLQVHRPRLFVSPHEGSFPLESQHSNAYSFITSTLVNGYIKMQVAQNVSCCMCMTNCKM